MSRSAAFRILTLFLLLAVYGVTVSPAAAQPPEADLRLTLSVDNATPNVGGSVVFTITVFNDGPDPTTGVEVTDLLPAGLSYASDDGGGAYTSGTGVWVVGALNNGSSATLHITATVQQEALPNVTNVAQVTASDVTDPDSTPGDNTGDDYATQLVTPVPPAAVMVTNLNDSGTGSLRWATQVVADGGTVNFQVGLTGTITLTSGQVSIDRSMTINGPGAAVIAVDINGANHFLVEKAGVTIAVEFIGLTLTGGSSTLAGGAAINNGGEDLTLTDMVLTDNHTTQNGGAVNNNAGNLYVHNTHFSNNSATASGGAILNNGHVEIYDSLFDGLNSADSGGAIYNGSGDTLLVQNTTFASNSVSNNGGAIANLSGGVITVIDCTFAGNNADDGGAILSGPSSQATIHDTLFSSNTAFNGGAIFNGGSMILFNSTITGNEADQNGGAIAAIANATLINVTVTDNTADADTNGTGEGGALRTTAAFSAQNTIIAGNWLGTDLSATDSDCFGTFTSLGNNVLGDGTGCTAIGSDQTIDPTLVATQLVSPLAGYGGPTLTHALPLNSIAINAGDATACANPVGVNNLDQRGVTRPQGIACDVGAYESDVDLVVSKSVDDATPDVGDSVIFTVTVTNNGSGDATNVVLTDLLPAGLTYVSDDGGGAYVSGTGVWTIGTLANGGGSTTLHITATVTSGAVGGVTNTATLTASRRGDYDNTNNSDTATVTPVVADLSLSKTVDDSTPNVGDNVIFTVTVSNAGPDAATNVVVTDLLPAGLTYVSDDGGGAYVSGTGVWTVGTVAASGSATLHITATVTSAAVGGVTNVAEVTASDQYDSDSTPNDGTGDDYDTVLVTPQVADLSLSKSVDDSTPNVGDSVIFTVTVSNAGPDAATGVVVEDLLPAGLSYVSDDGGGAYVSGTGVWTVGAVANGGSATLHITATVTSAAVPSATNAAEVTAADQYDSDSTPNDGAGDDYDTALVTPQVADLSLVKSVNDSTPNPGGSIIYTITVSNAGPDAATNVVLTDLLPSGVTYSSDDGGGAYVSGTGVWTVGTVAASGSATLHITATVDLGASGTITNTAEVTASDQYDGDSTPNNHVGSEDDQDSADITVGSADLSLSKTVDDSTPNVGDSVIFTVTVSNAGPDAATGVVVEDLLPAGLSYVSDDGGGAYVSGTGVWTVGTVAASGSKTLHITATVTSAAVPGATNAAEVTAADQSDPDSTPNDGTGDDYDTAVVTPQVADLSVSKTVDDATPNVGDSVIFTVTVSNAGPDAATNVVVTDLLPAGLTYVSDDGGGAYVSGTGVWTVGTVANGGSATLHITATVTSAAVPAATNAAEVTAVDQYDSDSTPNDGTGDDYDTAVVTPLVADLSLTKTVNNATPNVGQNVMFTITVSNAGPDTATNVAVTDLLPAGLTYLGDDGGGAYVSGTGVWTVGTLTNGASATLHITATVTSAAVGGVTNEAEVTAVDQYDSDSTPGDSMGDDYDTAVVTPQVADLSLTKSVDNATPDVGDNVTFTITVSNAGPDAATGVVVTDLLPAGLTYVSDDGGGAYVSGTGVWTVGTVAASGSATLHITATVTSAAAPSVTNEAEVTAADQYDSDSTPNDGAGDDYDTALVTPLAADLGLTKTVDNPDAGVGDSVIFTLTVSNAGPSAATNVAVTDLLPAGLTYVSDDGGGAYVSGTGVWTVGTVAASGSATLHITATVTSDAIPSVTNIAEVTASDQYDPDSTPNNGAPGEDDYATATISTLEADLWLTKTVDDPAPGIGDNVTFTITVTNDGPGSTNNVAVTDLLPAGLTYVSDDGGGAYVPGTGVWTVGTLANGASATLNITVTVTADIVGGVTNTAEVTASDAADPDSTPGNGVPGEDDQDSVTLNATYLAPGYYEETNPAFVYVGNWVFKAKASASGGSAAKAKAGASVEFYFAGDVLIIYRKTGPYEGPMEVCIDGSCRVVDNFSALGEWIQPVSFGVYEPGMINGPFQLAHHVTITRVGARFWFDAVEIVNLPAALPSGQVHQELHPNLFYVGEWQFKAKPAASGGTWAKTSDPDAAVYFRFTGNELTLYRTLGPAYGTMQVCIDGACQDVSNFNATKVWAAPWSSGPLAEGEHAVMIWNPYSATITLDAIWAGPGAPSSLAEDPPEPPVVTPPPARDTDTPPPPVVETPAPDRPGSDGPQVNLAH